MKFSNYLKTIELVPIKIDKVEISNIYAQYNYDRFKYWKSLVDTKDNDNILNMKYSPHVNFLNNIDKLSKSETSKYFVLQKLYGKNREWIFDKIDKFILLFDSIIYNGYDDTQPITILRQSIVPNNYNVGKYEIYEGHHRLACMLTIGESHILSQICDWRIQT